jgi:hypothetical protein
MSHTADSESWLSLTPELAFLTKPIPQTASYIKSFHFTSSPKSSRWRWEEQGEMGRAGSPLSHTKASH